MYQHHYIPSITITTFSSQYSFPTLKLPPSNPHGPHHFTTLQPPNIPAPAYIHTPIVAVHRMLLYTCGTWVTPMPRPNAISSNQRSGSWGVRKQQWPTSYTLIIRQTWWHLKMGSCSQLLFAWLLFILLSNSYIYI